MRHLFPKSTTTLLLVFSALLLNAQTASTAQNGKAASTAQNGKAASTGKNALSEQTDKAVQTGTSALARDVHASVFVASPGDVLYSRVGHCAIHMQAPDYNLDYVFSYEAEDVRHQVLRFLAGDLKMGMFAIPTQEYLDLYRNEGRGVVEYPLNLPIDVKRELWRVLDNHVMEGANLPYDYLNRGCAHSVLMMLEEALDTIPIVYAPWPEKFKTMTRRELMELQMKNSPWSKCFLYLITNGSVDAPCSKTQKIIVPADLVTILSMATVNGQTLLSKEGKIEVPETLEWKKTWFTPLLLSLITLILTMISLISKQQKFPNAIVDYLLLTIQTLLGTLTVYLVLFSNLVCTEWSWLIIPFNPIALIFWKWREYWTLPYAIIMVIWALVMTLCKHQITDWTYIVLALSLAVDYLRIFLFYKEFPTKRQIYG